MTRHHFISLKKTRLRICLTLILSVAVVLQSVGGAFALSAEQKKLIDSGVLYFNVDIASSGCGSVSLTGSDNAEKIYSFFISQGFQPYQAAGIMGNMKAESGLNPKRVQSTKTPDGDRDNITVDGKTGYGLVQWTSAGRQQGLADFAAAAGVPSGDLAVQLQYVMKELKESYKESAYDPLLASTTVEAATSIILENYEIPADIPGQRPVRTAFARDILAQFGSSSPGGTFSDSLTCGTSGEVVGGFSLPVDRKWYDENPGLFTKPHHDYPAADIPLPNGTPIYSMTAGTITSANMGGACGNGVSIDAGDGVTYIYCHGSDGGSVPGAGQGDEVNAGQLIMHSDNTGNSSGPHLHVGIHVDGQQVCPQTLFVGIADGSPPDVKLLPTSGCSY